MEKILPQQQIIIPVSWKRKIHYRRFYLEEWVDVKKVELYFNCFKKTNPFFKDIEFSRTRLSEFEENLNHDIEEYMKHSVINNIEDEIDKELITDHHDEDPEEELASLFEQSINPVEIKDEITIQHYDSVMCNKYEHEKFDESVVKRYAQIIIQYETVKNISNNFTDDFEQEHENEANQEDIFEEFGSELINNKNKNKTSLSKMTKTMDSDGVSEEAKKRISSIKAKIEKINIKYCPR